MFINTVVLSAEGERFRDVLSQTSERVKMVTVTVTDGFISDLGRFGHCARATGLI